MDCPVCGYRTEPLDTACKACLAHAKAPTAPKHHQESRLPQLLTVGSICALLLVLAMVVVLWLRERNVATYWRSQGFWGAPVVGGRTLSPADWEQCKLRCQRWRAEQWRQWQVQQARQAEQQEERELMARIEAIVADGVVTDAEIMALMGPPAHKTVLPPLWPGDMAEEIWLYGPCILVFEGGTLIDLIGPEPPPESRTPRPEPTPIPMPAFPPVQQAGPAVGGLWQR